MSFPRASAWR